MSTTQRERLASESVEQRAARLSANRGERLAPESSQLTCSNREELFKQRCVQLKMRNFTSIANLAALQSQWLDFHFYYNAELLVLASGTRGEYYK